MFSKYWHLRFSSRSYLPCAIGPYPMMTRGPASLWLRSLLPPLHPPHAYDSLQRSSDSCPGDPQEHQGFFMVPASVHPTLLIPHVLPTRDSQPSPKRSHHFPPPGLCFGLFHSLELFQFQRVHILAISQYFSVPLTCKEIPLLKP